MDADPRGDDRSSYHWWGRSSFDALPVCGLRPTRSHVQEQRAPRSSVAAFRRGLRRVRAERRCGDLRRRVRGGGGSPRREADRRNRELQRPRRMPSIRSRRFRLARRESEPCEWRSEQAGVGPEAVEYVQRSCSRVATPTIRSSWISIRSIFGEGTPRVPISAIKSMTGHTMGASGALQLVACALTIQTSTIPPTRNLGIADRIPRLRSRARRSAPTTGASRGSPTFGFGSRNAVLVVKQHGP